TSTSATAITRIGFEFLSALVPMSAAAGLMGRAIQVAFNHNVAINIPGVSLPTAKFIAEGQAFPVAKANSTSVQLNPYKLGVMAGVTSELFANPGAEAAIRQILIECVGPSLDAIMFGTAAAIPQQQPAGLLHNISPLTASTATGNEAMFADLENLGN